MLDDWFRDRHTRVGADILSQNFLARGRGKSLAFGGSQIDLAYSSVGLISLKHTERSSPNHAKTQSKPAVLVVL